MPQRRLTLYRHIVLIVIHIEERLRRIVDPPHHHRRNLNRVPSLIVHLQRLAIQRPRPQRHLHPAHRPPRPSRRRRLHPHVPARQPPPAKSLPPAAIQRIRPPEPPRPHRPLVRAKQCQHARLIRLQTKQSHKPKDTQI